MQFCAPYMRPDNGQTYADITSPLRQLTEQGKHFKWTQECQASFDRLKELLRDDIVLASYDPTNPNTRVSVDHGPEGLGSTLTQGHVIRGHRDLQYRPIIYHSRSLTKAEKGYGKIEGESLSVLAGVMVNRTYLYST